MTALSKTTVLKPKVLIISAYLFLLTAKNYYLCWILFLLDASKLFKKLQTEIRINNYLF